MCGTDIFLAILALLFPPVAVWVKRGICSADSLINIALCCLGLLPGLLHAWYIIWAYPDRDDYEHLAPGDAENGHVTYYYVTTTGAPARGGNNNSQQYRSGHAGGPSYGAAGGRPVPASTSSQQFPGQQQGVVNPWANEPSGQAAQPSKGGSGAAQPAGPQASGGEGSASQPPPTYAEAVRGDHKIQSHD
ncbi:putative stress response rci peptide protein [Neofusicoccum parvum UCRNP2]|uniref:Uncharacterized protein n=2 Tax=Neofusicoccum parvum TaxID=310453 RepID=A0ACB5SJJ5_9PEZI|nr:putative stress response rci peptide protein [Neofusicoccum parvum UCRNP2]GME43864.1 hypothetical protein GTA08_BOTSDO11779 [Neofusicoccum parvum]